MLHSQFEAILSYKRTCFKRKEMKKARKKEGREGGMEGKREEEERRKKSLLHSLTYSDVSL